jgi:hypothetical protein
VMAAILDLLGDSPDKKKTKNMAGAMRASN